MAIPKGSDVIPFLIKIGAIKKEATIELKDVQIEALLDMLIKNRSILKTEIDEAREILNRLGSQAGGIRQQVTAKTDMIKLITDNMHRRMSACGDRTMEQRSRFQSDNYPAIAKVFKED